jgi:hypothetical protein
LFIVNKVKFGVWLDSIATRLAIPNEAGVLTVYNISRADFVDRVANVLGGSHPIGNKELINDNNWPIKHLMNFELLGLPLSYTIVLKIAQDILTSFNIIK